MAAKKKNLSRYLTGNSLPIAVMGEAISVKIEDVEPGERMAIQRADDEFIIINKYQPTTYYFIGVFFLLLASFFAVVDFNKGEIPFFSLPLILIAAFLFIYGFTIPNREIILDRQNGLLTLPGFLWSEPVTFPFNEAEAYLGATGWPPTLTLTIRRLKQRGYVILTYFDQIQTWNMYVWYMDKNRPLPPGTAFDPYRKKDYERRKKAGFPPPLYDSVIPTPENPLDTRHVKSVSPNDYYQ